MDINGQSQSMIGLKDYCGDLPVLPTEISSSSKLGQPWTQGGNYTRCGWKGLVESLLKNTLSFLNPSNIHPLMFCSCLFIDWFIQYPNHNFMRFPPQYSLWCTSSKVLKEVTLKSSFFSSLISKFKISIFHTKNVTPPPYFSVFPFYTFSLARCWHIGDGKFSLFSSLNKTGYYIHQTFSK